ncbi:alpha/beta hydrolase [Micromonospora sp. C31]|uniref:alpha/beta fold hydrolase n=1 Tax=Micromonospora sp. C31 TaxID=2824876 RepID=UPI001B38C52B|nr:alpha/beta hydrolase [Micromonospora sp. C31]MBQ1076233.1 alpha/beta hydrolase [Micromonospora sp. C31]
MPHIDRPDGARIHYQEQGRGPAVLLLAPGGPVGEISDWRHAPVDPTATLAERFRVIAVDQRHAGPSRGPLAPYDHQVAAADLLAVLDALGVGTAAVVAAGASTTTAWRLAHDAPQRIGAVVALAPVGLDDSNSLGDFFGLFDAAMRLPRAAFFDDPESEGMAAVVEAARRDGSFASNPAAGPYARPLAEDPDFAGQVLALRREKYVTALVRFRDGQWPAGRAFFSVPDEWLAGADLPVLVLPGDDRLSPPGAAKRLATDLPNATLADAGWSAPDRRARTATEIAEFLTAQNPN